MNKVARIKGFVSSVSGKAIEAVPVGLAVGALTLADSTESFAQGTASGLVNWSEASDDLKAEMTPALTAGVAIGMILLGIALGYKLLRRFAR